MIRLNSLIRALCFLFCILLESCTTRKMVKADSITKEEIVFDSAYSVILFKAKDRLIGIKYTHEIQTINAQLIDTTYKTEFKKMNPYAGFGLWIYTCSSSSCHQTLDFFKDSVDIRLLQSIEMKNVICDSTHNNSISGTFLCNQLSPIEIDLISEFLLKETKRE
jgi:hypothetical protein